MGVSMRSETRTSPLAIAEPVDGREFLDTRGAGEALLDEDVPSRRPGSTASAESLDAPWSTTRHEKLTAFENLIPLSFSMLTLYVTRARC